MFRKVISYLNQPLIITLTGPRRVGKTVLMKQVINHLISEGYPRRNILFFSFDEEVEEIIPIINAWEELIGRKVRGNKFFLFLDEIQKLDNWAKKVKLIYDALDIKIFLSGSASTEVKKGSESLAGRAVDLLIEPLSFSEYLTFSGKANIEIEEERWREYLFYIHRQLPDLVIYPSLNSKEYIGSIVKKVIYEDIRRYYGVEEPEIVESIFKSICREPGQIIAVSDIAKDFGISRPTASNYLLALEKSFLLRKLYNFSRNARKVEVRSKKYYPYYTNLVDYVELTEISKMIETEVAWKTNADFFWNDRGKEIDFIKNFTGIEVKTRKVIDSQDVKWLLYNNLKLKNKVLVTIPTSELRLKNKIKVVYLHELENYKFEK
ncbi:MAG: ATP-binding protein [Candidatus Aenigmarchaeota archaeon]|nr:ATP-binding protein [Candidatus Aenigmarchaeota archaeon]